MSSIQVAAAEMDEKEWQMTGQSADWVFAQQLRNHQSVIEPGVENIHGPAMTGGFWAVPKLLPVAAAAAPITAFKGALPRKHLFDLFIVWVGDMRNKLRST